MKALILAAGYGRRMRPFTDTTHKCLLPIAGRSVIRRLVDDLVRLNASEVTVVTGYRADEVEAHLRASHPSVPFRFIRNERYAETNNVVSLALAFESLVSSPDDGEDVLVIEADLIVEPGVFDRLMRSPYANVALVDRYRSGLDGTVVALSGDEITGIFPSHRQTLDFDFSDKYKTLNIYRFASSFCRGPFQRLLSYYAHAVDSNCFYEVILGIIIALQREPIHAAVLEGERWAEIDDPNDLDAARFVFDPQSRAAMLSQSHGGYWAHQLVDHAYLRNQYFPTGAMLSELRHNLPRLIQNYGSSQQQLSKKLAWALLVQPSRLRVLNGAAEAFPLLARHFAQRRVWIPRPTFGEYARAFPEAMPYDDAVGIDRERLVAQVAPGDAVVFVNPNNPTGTTLPSAWIADFARSHPDIEVVVDESFLDFSSETSVISRLEQEPATAMGNVIVLKSLSKCWGVPGLRLGFSYATNRAWTERLDAELPIWNVNSVAEHLVEITLKHKDALAASFMKSRADRDALVRDLAEVEGVETVYPSGGNYVLIRLVGGAEVAGRVTNALIAEHGVWVKDVSSKLAGGFLRLAVRTPHENGTLVRLLSAALTPSDRGHGIVRHP